MTENFTGGIFPSASYNQLLGHLETAQGNDFLGVDQEVFKFRAIIGHQGPLKVKQHILIERVVNTMFKLNGRLGRLPLSPFL